MRNLIVGSTSQLSYYFPKKYDRISSRNIDFKSIIDGKYNNVFILFAEQRTFLNEDENFFFKVNVDYTLKLINKIKNYVNKIIIYSTSELWNNVNGEIDLNKKFDYGYTPYIKSKEVLCDTINEKKNQYGNIKIVYPFNFNSPYRKEGFLFGKIFNSILNKEKIIVGDLNFYRDIVHPKIIVKNSIDVTDDLIIGSGELINIEKFVNNLYNLYGLNYKDYISINEVFSSNKRKNYFSKIKFSSEKELLRLTFNDLRKYSTSKRYYN